MKTFRLWWFLPALLAAVLFCLVVLSPGDVAQAQSDAKPAFDLKTPPSMKTSFDWIMSNEVLEGPVTTTSLKLPAIVQLDLDPRNKEKFEKGGFAVGDIRVNNNDYMLYTMTEQFRWRLIQQPAHSDVDVEESYEETFTTSVSQMTNFSSKLAMGVEVGVDAKFVTAKASLSTELQTAIQNEQSFAAGKTNAKKYTHPAKTWRAIWQLERVVTLTCGLDKQTVDFMYRGAAFNTTIVEADGYQHYRGTVLDIPPETTYIVKSTYLESWNGN